MARATFLLLCLSALSLAGSSPEEELVRRTYAKLSYLTELRALRLAMDSDLKPASAPDFASGGAAPADSVVRFHIEDVVVGPYSEIAQRVASEVIARPPGKRLDFVVRTVSFRDDGRESSLLEMAPRWSVAGGAYADAWRMPLDGALKLDEPNGQYETYALFTVKLDYDRQEFTYRALFLFGGRNPPTILRIVDLVINPDVLASAGAASLVPSAFVVGPYEASPRLAAWVKAKEALHCEATDESGCCDLAALSCKLAH